METKNAKGVTGNPNSTDVRNKRRSSSSENPSKKKKKKKTENDGKLFRSSTLKQNPSSSSSKHNVEAEVRFGLDGDTTAKFIKETSSCFPDFKQPLLSSLTDGVVKIKGQNLIDESDLSSLIGSHKEDEDNYLNNFVIDAYLNLLASKSVSNGLKVKVIEWEMFEKALEKKQSKKVLKDKGNPSILDQYVIFVPCNPGTSAHWFLLVALPVEKKIIALDSLGGSFIKPSVKRAISKMWNLLKEFDKDLDTTQWCLCCNTTQDIPQQQNIFDCGVYTCLYARSLLFQSPMVSSASIPSFRKQIAVELHQQELHDFSENEVEYQTSFYFGRALENEENSMAKFKFLHSSGTRLYDWPTRDDIDTCHKSCVFYGPCSIFSNGPFMFPDLPEIEQVYQFLKKSRK